MSQTENEHRNRQSKDAKQLETYVRPREGASIIGVGLSTIWWYIKNGKLKSYKLSDKVTVLKRSELKMFVESRLVEVA